MRITHEEEVEISPKEQEVRIKYCVLQYKAKNIYKCISVDIAKFYFDTNECFVDIDKHLSYTMN